MSNLVEIARGWAGRWFNPGAREQCALFVRSVFREAGVPVGVAVRPSDWRQTAGQPQGPAYANSFAGDEVGQRISRIEDLRAGDVVMWANTYGEYAAGTITHVGIYVGGGEFVHRPTMSRPVERAALAGYWADRFAEGRRVPGARSAPAATPELERLKVYFNGDRVRVFDDSREVEAATVKVFVHNGKLGLAVNGREVDPASVTVELAYRRGTA